MLGCKCLYWSRGADYMRPEPEAFVLPGAVPQWSQGSGFGGAMIKLGELEVCQITKFQHIWGWNMSLDGKQARAAAKIESHGSCNLNSNYMPPLSNPVDYSLIWCSEDGNDNFNGCGYFWLPQPPEGYKALGYLATNKSEKPDLEEVKCVRADLTDGCEAYRLIVNTYSNFSKAPFVVLSMRPLHRGIYGRGVSVGSFYCSSYRGLGEELNVACLKNLDQGLHAMPNIDHIHAIVQHYGPTVFFHPNEVYLPSSVSWFFRNGAMLLSSHNSGGEAIDIEGSNLPCGETNDGKYWIDLPSDTRRENVKRGNLESAKLYIHVKPALGGTFTDIVMWVFCPFNGPATLKLGMMDVALSKIGQHVGDWEHFTLRISNFTGELWSIYFSQHSGGIWVDASDLEFIEGNKAIIYSSKSGHASFPHPGNHIQGSSKLGIGLRNDAAFSNYFIDSSKNYEIIAAEYLGDEMVKEPFWLQYMREWGPTIVYDSRTELDKIIKILPVMVRYSVESIFNKLPLELYGEEGPTGPKEKNNWIGDERC
ncbi:hypothetical protein At1g04090-like isoform X2 [Henckelia pumila]|uniref:hypothetical protein At1g04090-like isoform X2 n=1 Tax=Henckelia pumila TaxID=405737 RepID=UPI003C6E6408